ncbi:MAG: CBS domain-containing protein [Planctomycetota bacterium]|nr:MAG: CBS domain-containing protein [Planctomycetota bacterium]
MADSNQNSGGVPDPNFEDPLSQYDPPEYSDPLEQSLVEEKVGVLQTQPYESVPPDATIREAVEKLIRIHHACLLVEEDGKLVGMFTDRDFLNRVALEYEELADQPVSSVMVKDPVYVYETEDAAATLSVMAVSGFRHVPFLNLEHKLVGIVTPRRVTQFLHEHASPE